MTDSNSKRMVDPSDLAMLFRRASRTMARVYHRRDHAHHAQDHVLAIVREQGPINQRVLLETLDVRSSSLSEILRKLEGRGLIVRKRDEQDRRGFVVSATDQGLELGKGRESYHEDSANRLFDCLDEEERLRLYEILEKLVASLFEDPLSRESPCDRHGGKRFGKGGGRGRGRGRRK